MRQLGRLRAPQAFADTSSSLASLNLAGEERQRLAVAAAIAAQEAPTGRSLGTLTHATIP